MTVIAYRDGVMAADTMVIVNDNVKLLDEIKIGKHKGYLFGLAGEVCPSLRDFKRWFFSDLGQDRRSPFRGKFDFSALVVTPEGNVQHWEETGTYELIKKPFYAVGAGKEFAIGAMEMGATAPESVQVAIKWCPTVGGKVLTRKLRT